MIETAMARSIVLVLFGLTLIWLIKIIVKQEYETLLRALIVLVVFGAIFLYLNQTKLEKLSWKAVQHEFFPSKAQAYKYDVREISSGGLRITRYSFDEPGPKLKLTLDADGKYLQITDIDPVNSVLTDLGLPAVTSGAKDLSIITGKLTDVGRYRWDDYERGVLTIESGICRDNKSLETFHCIESLSLQK